MVFFLINGLHTLPNETSNQVTEKGEKADENLQFDLEEVNYQTDKYHMIGLIKTKGGTQATIFRFKTHSFTKAIY